MPSLATVDYLLGQRFYRMAYLEYGAPSAPVVVCVHGLTRNGRDFAPLAEALAQNFHVICPDLPGRGASEWLSEPMAYQPPTYVVALSYLLAQLNKPVAWVGTSLGGICGLMLAAAQNSPITRLVLNDLGPHIPAASLLRIRDYMSAPPPSFPSLAALEAHLRRVNAPFGPLTAPQWRYLAEISARPLPDGSFALHYDPAIADPIRATMPVDADLWPIWEAVRIPRLVVRGAQSDLLLPETYARMLAEGAEGLEVAGAGHAPALMDPPTIARIQAFLHDA
ncbi:alpha/beta fold hydrolase [Acidocella sp.]|uniref:alpha/beta fold hydrolase n=1 Tax=Acidocella sp. TaxID=50710 RepID=UPI00261028BE|nr:alpha/beta hydrolase [Acidocella sp.]